MKHRFFFGAGPGDIIAAHAAEFSGQMSVTFSSEFEALCAANDADGLLISSCDRLDMLQDGRVRLENRPKRKARGMLYHLEEIRYGVGLALSARRFKATHAFIQSGSTHYFVMVAFRAFGIKVIPILHNTLWPAGLPQTTLIKSAIRRLDGKFFERSAHAILVVSQECSRQIASLAKQRPPRIELFTPQFNENKFQPTPPIPLAESPLTITFAGRVTEDKGALDLVTIAQKVLAHLDILIHVCGEGHDLDRLRRSVADHHLEKVVVIHGWTAPSDLRQIIASSHLSIVPTRSTFNEGMAMTAVEAILLGRPVITNNVVPAAEVLQGACVIAETDNPESYANEIITLAADHDRYDRLCSACLPLRSQFFNRNMSSQSAMQRVLQ